MKKSSAFANSKSLTLLLNLTLVATAVMSLPSVGYGSERKVREKIGPSRTRVVRDREVTAPGHEAGTGAAVFMGAGGGQLLLQPDDPEAESEKSGLFLQGKLAVSLYTENWVFDLGAGWFFTDLPIEEAGLAEIPPEDSELEEVNQMSLSAGILEFSPRIRLGENWQIGPTAQGFISTDDVSFSARWQDRENPQSFSLLVGAQLMYGVPKTQADWRAGVEYSTDININDRQVHIITGTIQFGLPFVSPDTIKKSKVLLREHRRTEIIENRRVKTKVVVREVMKFIFERKHILFLSGGTVLHPDSQTFLLELSKRLQAASSLWETLAIEGHSGIDSVTAQNDKLTKARAFNVRAALVGGGLESSRVSSKGFGSSKPLLKRSPSPHDERIVFSFTGVKDARLLSAVINGIREKYHIPETCSEAGCR